MSQLRIRRRRHRRICQGDIIRNVELIEHVHESRNYIEVSKINYPLIVVLTQDCDLQQDYGVRWGRERPSTQDQAICSVLVAPIYNVEHVYQGLHLSELNMRSQVINKNKSPGMTLRSNQQPRYHYLEFPAGVPLPPGVVDFKHYFSVNVMYLRKRKTADFVCQLAPLYREALSLRFANHLSRIGLPDEKRLATNEPATTAK